jgi:putative membrane protein
MIKLQLIRLKYMAEPERTLILCIDSDDDIGIKGKVKTPLIGREANIQAATRLALADPEEADANAMFGAVKLFDKLVKDYSDEVFEIATIAGSGKGGVVADRAMVKELGSIQKLFSADAVILVTDGFADEDLVPIVQSRIPITSIHHVVVKHSERIEETYAVIFRYLKMAVEDPNYSKVSLGVPGILLVIFGFLMASNQLENAGMVVAFVMGVVLVLKGFGWDSRLSELKPRLPPPDRWINLITTGLGGVVFIIGIVRGIDFAWSIIPLPIAPFWDLAYWATNSADLIGAFVTKGTDMLALGLGIAIAGDGISTYVQNKDDPKVWSNMIGILLLLWMRPISIEAALIIRNPDIPITMFSPLIIYTVLGVVTLTLFVTWVYRRHGREWFKRAN